jgi:hypothetical protein
MTEKPALAVVVAESKETSPDLKAGDSKCLSRARQGLSRAAQVVLESGKGVVCPTPGDAGTPYGRWQR